MELPKSVRFLVIGAGVHGLSTAYHLAKELEARGEGSGEDILIVAGGVIPAPLIDHPTHQAKPAAKVTRHRPRELAHELTETSPSFPDYAPESSTEVEPQPQPRETVRAEGEAEAEKQVGSCISPSILAFPAADSGAPSIYLHNQLNCRR